MRIRRAHARKCNNMLQLFGGIDLTFIILYTNAYKVPYHGRYKYLSIAHPGDARDP